MAAEITNILGMSDDEIAKLDPSQLVAPTSEEPTSTEDTSEQAQEDTSTQAEDTDPEQTGEGEAGTEGANAEDADGAATDATSEEDTTEKTDQPADKGAQDGQKGKQAKADAVQDPEKKPEVNEENKPPVDYEAVYKQIFAPFKANGREITPESVNDVVALMQMGANYNKKMAALKPNLRILKMLENNNLLDEDKLSYLIDLDKKNPDAVKKLVKDAGIDPIDIDVSKASEYKPGNHSVDPTEMALNEELDKIQDTPTFKRTLQVVSNEWDDASKRVISTKPQLIGYLNGHIQSGVFDLITEKVASERTFGRLKDMSDLDAYSLVGEMLDQQGAFAHLAPKQEPKAAPTQVVATKPKVDKETEERLRDKKRAVSSPKTAATPAKVKPDFNPLALSDDEFKKLSLDKFL